MLNYVRVGQCAVVLMCALSVVACSGVKERREAYRHANVPPPLEVPPSLQSPQGADALVLPQRTEMQDRVSADAATSASDQGQLGALADVSGVRLERDGALGWLVVGAPAAQVWPQVKDYLNRYGPPLHREHEAFMTLETDWVAPPADKERRSRLGKLFGKLYSSGTREKFRIRLAPGVVAGTTEVHVAQQRMQQAAVDESVRWLPAPADLERERDLLKRMMVHFGMDSQGAERALLQAIEVTTALARQDGQTYLEITAPFSWAWPRLGLALDRADIAVSSSDRDTGEFHVVFPYTARSDDDGALFFARKKQVVEVPLRLVVDETGGITRVIVRDDEGTAADDGVAERVLKAVRKQL